MVCYDLTPTLVFTLVSPVLLSLAYTSVQEVASERLLNPTLFTLI